MAYKGTTFIYLTRRLCCALLCLTLLSCVSVNSVDRLVVVSERDLVDQARTGNGEGLAKSVPGQPLLVNNQLIFSTMGDAVLGIAIATGAIRKTIDLFAGMKPLTTIEWTKAALDAQADDRQWQPALAALSEKRQHLIIEPYCYLDGHPSATLQVRLKVNLLAGDKTVWSTVLTESSEKQLLQGELSWSADQGAQVIEFTQNAIPRLIARLPAELDKYHKI